MDKTTKHIVASNLTIAHFAAQPICQSPDPDQRKSLVLVEEHIMATYERFLTLLSKFDESDGNEGT